MVQMIYICKIPNEWGEIGLVGSFGGKWIRDLRIQFNFANLVINAN